MFERKYKKNNIPIDEYINQEGFSKCVEERYKCIKEYNNCIQKYHDFLTEHIKLSEDYMQLMEKRSDYFDKYPTEVTQVEADKKINAQNERIKEQDAEKERLIAMLKEKGIDYEDTTTEKNIKRNLAKNNVIKIENVNRIHGTYHEFFIFNYKSMMKAICF